MKRKRERKTSSVLKGGFDTDQPLKVGTLYKFVYTLEPGGPEIVKEGWFVKESDGYYHTVEQRNPPIPVDRVIEVNEIIGRG